MVRRSIGDLPAATRAVVGGIVESVPLFVAGLLLPGLHGLLVFLAGRPRRAREAAVAPRTALAMIENLRAIGGESSDVPVRWRCSGTGGRRPG